MVGKITVKDCRERAKLCRDNARTELDPKVRKQYDDLAASWEQICEQLEAIQAKR